MKIDCEKHEDNQCLFLCVGLSCTSKSRFLCQECITEQAGQHNHSMVSLSQLNKKDQSAQFKLLSFADTKKEIIQNLKLQNVDEKVSKISSFYEKIQQQIQEAIQNRMDNDINECISTACSTTSLMKNSRIDDLSSVLNIGTSQGSQEELDKSVNDFFKEYHQDQHQVQKFLNSCMVWEEKFSFAENQDNLSKELLFKFQQLLNKLSPIKGDNKVNGLAIEAVNCIKNDEILLPPTIKFLPEEQVFSKVDGPSKHQVGIIDIPITRQMLKTPFKVKVHACRWVGVGICERDHILQRDYQCDINLLDQNSGLWFVSSNANFFTSYYQEYGPYNGTSGVSFHVDDTLVVTPYDYKIEYYSEGNPNRIFSMKFAYDDNKVYCPCFVMYSNSDTKIEFVQ